LDPKIIQDDGALSFRALLEGGILYVDKVLVKYRRHSNNIYDLGDPVKKVALYRKEYAMKKSWLFDAERSSLNDTRLIHILKREYAKSLFKRGFYSTPLLGISVIKAIDVARNIRNKYRTLARK